MAKSGKAIYSKLNHIYISGAVELWKCTLYSRYSLFSVLSCCTYLKSSIKNSLSQSSPCNFFYPVLCVHLDRACALLCDPNMIDMQNDELTWNTTSMYAWKIWEMIWEMILKTIWYVQNASRVVLKDNENGKILGPPALMCAHALVDTPIPSRWYGSVHY